MVISTLICTVASLQSASLPPLTVRGKDLVNPSGQVVSLRGTNVGNWFVIEPWMLAAGGGEAGFRDQFEMMEILKNRFGRAEAEKLLDLYKSHWITEKDFATIKSFGFNLIRLPMNYRQFEDDERPMVLRRDAWKWVDRALVWAERHGMYVILDMHGVQGGQSVYDHTGHSGQNKLWSEPKNQERLAWLWEQIAKRYKNRSVVIAYDVKNEPYGGSKEDSVKVFRKVLERIRKVDPETLVFAHGHWDDFSHFGNPRENGWRNVGFQMHYYPGLFGGGRPTFRTHRDHLLSIRNVARRVDELNVPFLIGEMNVVFKNLDAPRLMRHTFDTHASFGWMTTMWSYKVLTSGGGIGGGSWGMVTNRKPFRPLNVKTASKAEIEAQFRSLSTMEIEVYEELRQAMTAKNFRFEFPPIPEPRTVAPANETLDGWMQEDIGGSLKGGLRKADGGFELFGGGEDIWNNSDQFRFLYQKISGDFEILTQVKGLEDHEQYAKAGLMVRASLAPNSPHAMLSTFADGEMQFASRTSPGGGTTAPDSVKGDMARLFLRLVRKGSRVEAFHGSSSQGPWVSLGQITLPLGDEVYAGAVSLSHNNRTLVKATYGFLAITPLR